MFKEQINGIKNKLVVKEYKCKMEILAEQY